MFSKKNVLVAGGTGLIGSNLTLRLQEMGSHIRSTYFSKRPSFLKECYRRFDFTKLEDCVEATRDIDIAFLCAAQNTGAQGMQDRSNSMILSNLRIYSGLLEGCYLNNVERVVFLSSSTIYQEAEGPICENELDLNKPPYKLYFGIGWMIRYIEQLAKFYYEKHGLKIAIARPTNIYGPYDQFEEGRSHVLPALIKRALQRENPFVVWGDGKTVRDFIYVDDFIDDLLKLVTHCCACDPINICHGQSITIRDAVQVVLEVCDHNVEPYYDATKPSAIPYRVLNDQKYRSMFGNTKRTPFNEGIQNTVDWYKTAVRN